MDVVIVHFFLYFRNTAQMMDVTAEMTVGPHNSHHDPNTLGIGHNDLSEPSSPESTFDESDLFSATITDDVTAQLVAAGLIYIRLSKISLHRTKKS